MIVAYLANTLSADETAFKVGMVEDDSGSSAMLDETIYSLSDPNVDAAASATASEFPNTRIYGVSEISHDQFCWA